MFSKEKLVYRCLEIPNQTIFDKYFYSEYAVFRL